MQLQERLRVLLFVFFLGPTLNGTASWNVKQTTHWNRVDVYRIFCQVS